MSNGITNFGRFYAAFNSLRIPGDAEEYKRMFVSQFTNGRTDHLHEMTRAEYDRCCDALEERSGRKAELRKQRSRTLRLMQQMGIDTTNWAKIDDFCRNPRIMGKVFRHITVDEHSGLQRKLRAIMAKDKEAAKKRAAEAPAAPVTQRTEKYYLIDLGTQDPAMN